MYLLLLGDLSWDSLSNKCFYKNEDQEPRMQWDVYVYLLQPQPLQTHKTVQKQWKWQKSIRCFKLQTCLTNTKVGKLIASITNWNPKHREKHTESTVTAMASPANVSTERSGSERWGKRNIEKVPERRSAWPGVSMDRWGEIKREASLVVTRIELAQNFLSLWKLLFSLIQPDCGSDRWRQLHQKRAWLAKQRLALWWSAGRERERDEA